VLGKVARPGCAVAALGWVLTGVASAWAGTQATFFVSPTGADTNPGTITQPFQTLYRAQAAVRAVNTNMTGNILVYLRAGTYALTNTLTFGPADTGDNGFRVRYSAYQAEAATISGGKIINGWTLHDAAKNIWKAEVAGTDNFRQMYVNGIKATRARSVGPPAGWTLTATGYTTTDTNLQHYGNVTNLEVVAAPHGWTRERLPVASVQGSAITLQEPCLSIAGNGPNLGFDNPVWLENAYEFLTAPGYWYLDLATHTLYYIPRPWENLATATLEVPVVEELLLLNGSATSPVSNLTFSGLTFRLSNWLQPSTSLGMPSVQANQSWPPYEDWYVKAGIECLGARNVEVRSCVFRELGGNGINFLTASQSNVVSDCQFFSVASCSVQVALARSTVEARLPSGSGDIVAGIVVSNCVIHDVCTDYQPGCGIFTGYCQSCAFVGNLIYNIPSTALSLGWGWSDPAWASTYTSGNQILRNRIYNHTQVLPDGGGIYCLGEQQQGLISSNYVSNQGGGYGHIYLDDGADNWSITFNVCERANGYIWYFYKGSNNVANGNFTDTPVVLDWGVSNILTNTTLVSNQLWPPAALAIMNAAGSSLAGTGLSPASGTFTAARGGVWGVPQNWNANTVATGSDQTADFSTMALTADTTVLLDDNYTIGKLMFGDTGGVHNWVVGPAGMMLTLTTSSNNPVISVNNRVVDLLVTLAGNTGLNKTGNGTLRLSGRYSYLAGPTTVNQGTLLVNGTLPADTSLTVLPNATLGGTGVVNGTVTVNGLIATADTVGTLTTGPETWNGGGLYVCKVNSTNTSGCDQLNINGSLNLQATSVNPFTLKLVSLTASNSPGELAGFNPYASYTWLIVTASGNVQNFATNRFVLDTSGFSNRFNGVFGIANPGGSSLAITYTPPVLVPIVITSRTVLPEEASK
jgi:autotransporter-associated beta strand protein